MIIEEKEPQISTSKQTKIRVYGSFCPLRTFMSIISSSAQGPYRPLALLAGVAVLVSSLGECWDYPDAASQGWD